MAKFWILNRAVDRLGVMDEIGDNTGFINIDRAGRSPLNSKLIVYNND